MLLALEEPKPAPSLAALADCDIILPVYNGLSHVCEAVDSVLEYTQDVSYRLIIIDDASDHQTARYLVNLAECYSYITLLRNAENQGFVRSCIRGYEVGEAPFLLLLNSDVVVTPGWLSRLLLAATSDSRIAAVNPLTNRASHLELPIVPGANFFSMDAALRDTKSTLLADVVTGVGFCLLLRRTALASIGLFDEIYGRGYGEDSDLCMRLTTSGKRTVAACNVYVYHQGGGTFDDIDARKRRNRKLFDQRWGAEYQRQFQAFQRTNPLAPIRARFATPHRWDPLPLVWESARAMLAAWRQRAWLDLTRAALRGAWHLPRARSPQIIPAQVKQFSRDGRLQVTYVIPRLVIAGGVLSVIQLVNRLILMGVDARIATLFEDPAIRDWMPLYTRPMVFRNERELLRDFPVSDLAVATLWTTASWVAALRECGRITRAVYFLQGYEPWFFPDTDPAGRAQVRSTYALIPHRIVKSDWLGELLSTDGYVTRKIHLGINLSQFYPRDVISVRPIVLAMARPHAHQGGFIATLEALALVKAARPEVEIVLFGDRFLDRCAIPFDFRDEGIVTNQNRLAYIYSQATVFLDGSDFQGFGRGGLEAMACGTACVLTWVGGVNEYARDGENASMVPPAQPDRFAAAILALLDDPIRRTRQEAAGLETARAFCHRREARETLAYFQAIMTESAPT